MPGGVSKVCKIIKIKTSNAANTPSEFLKSGFNNHILTVYEGNTVKYWPISKSIVPSLRGQYDW